MTEGPPSIRQLEIEAALRLARRAHSKYLKANSFYFAVRRELHWRPGRITDPRKSPVDFNDHESYPNAVMLQIHGLENKDSAACVSCQRNGGPFDECVSFDPNEEFPDRLAGEDPLFNGVCGNCFWGGQGSGCSLRVSGSKSSLSGYSSILSSHAGTIHPRKRRHPLFQSDVHSYTHLGSAYDLSLPGPCDDAIGHLQGMINNLRLRRNALSAGRSVDDMTLEPQGTGPFDKSDEEGEEVADDRGPYALRSRGPISGMPSRGGQDIRFPSNEPMNQLIGGGRSGHMRIFSNGSIQMESRGSMQVVLGGSPRTLSGPLSPRLPPSSPMQLSSRGNSPNPFFDFDRAGSQSPELTRGPGPIALPGSRSASHSPELRRAPGPSQNRPRAPSKLGRNFETKEMEEDYQPPGSRKGSGSGKRR